LNSTKFKANIAYDSSEIKGIFPVFENYIKIKIIKKEGFVGFIGGIFPLFYVTLLSYITDKQ